MVYFFLTTLVISIVGLASLLSIKSFELSTGRVAFARARPQINRFFHTCLVLVERVLPGLVHEGAVNTGNAGRALIQKMLARAILWLETMLHSVLQSIREKTHPTHHRGEASPFLREVGEYKKQLENESDEVLPKL